MRSGKLYLSIQALKVRAARALLGVSLLLGSATTFAHAQTFSVLHAFDGADGNAPFAGLTADADGNLYGTTSIGGNNGCLQHSGCGTIYKLSRSGSTWTFTTLHRFLGGRDGWGPMARVEFGADGSLYGTTEYGGYYANAKALYGYGTVFRLRPPAPDCISCAWTYSVIYRFRGHADGAQPTPGDLTFDQAGNVYGTTGQGGIKNTACVWGNAGCGVVYKLTASGNSWTESVVYQFTGGNDGDTPNAGVVFDQQGNLYGTTTSNGKYLYGSVFQLTPSPTGWTENTIHAFAGLADGAYPGGLTEDNSGNLFGITTAGSPGENTGGTVFELRPSGNSWVFTVLTEFVFPASPTARPTIDNGNLYGAAFTGGPAGAGGVFELEPGSSKWTLVNLYTFTGLNDGNSPVGSVFVDASGNVYGTTLFGGLYSDGVVFEVSP